MSSGWKLRMSRAMYPRNDESFVALAPAPKRMCSRPGFVGVAAVHPRSLTLVHCQSLPVTPVGSPVTGPCIVQAMKLLSLPSPGPGPFV